MKIRYYISFNEGRANYQRMLRLLRAAGCEDGLAGPDDFLCGLYGRMFDADDPQLDNLRQALRAARVKWSERCEHVYADSELRAAPLLLFSVSTGHRDLGWRPREAFDWSTGCPRCGAGARQVTPLRITPGGHWHRGLPRKGLICQTLDQEYLVTGPLYEALANAGLVGLELLQVRSSKDQPLPWWQIVPRHEMPPMAPETRGIVPGRDADGRPQQGCVQCGRDNHFATLKEPMQIAYRRSQFGTAPLPDVTQTYECFGLSGLEEERYLAARPHVLVSPRVLDIFRKLKVRAGHFVPVRIIED